jgi:putative tryptophan/tyrosine transport system substrate-binding protein
MRRREFIAGLGSAVALPAAARAQQPALPVIGYLNSSTADAQSDSLAAFQRGLAQAGYAEGRNVTIERRWAEDHSDRLPLLADDLVRRRVAVIATGSSAPSAAAAKAATQSIPIVFVMGANPVEIGLVASLARPGGNITGFTILAQDVLAKRLALLHELVPAAATIAYLAVPLNKIFLATTDQNGLANLLLDPARRLGIQLLYSHASNPQEIERAFGTIAENRAGAVLVAPDPFFFAQRDQLVALAAHYAIPASYSRREAVEAGGLISYDGDLLDAQRLAGTYVGRILKGEKPSDLPVQQATRFRLALNLKTAKALGLDVPTSILVLADEVIE